MMWLQMEVAGWTPAQIQLNAAKENLTVGSRLQEVTDCIFIVIQVLKAVIIFNIIFVCWITFELLKTWAVIAK